MPATYKDNGGSVNGSNKVFTYDFPTLQTEDVKVALNGVTQATTKYTVSLSPANITFNNNSVDSSVQESDGSPKSGVTVRVYRETTVGKATGDEDPKAVFAAGSSIRASDLNANVEQALFGIHEQQDKLILAENINTGAVTSAKILDDTIVNADVNASAAIAGTKVNPNFGSQAVSTSGTLAAGATTVTGNITVSGTVDGRDVATDGSKLDGIEAGATGNQTNTEIRAAVEAASDSNVFTDADHSKLNAIEASATADQTASEIRTLVEAASDSNVFTDADHTKLNSVATLTGSETLTNKTLTSPVINDMSGTAVVTSGTSTSDTKTYSAKRAGEIFYGKDTVGEIQSGETWSAADDKVATTSAIDARIIDLVDDVGGFVPIANETSFPNANPDVNNGAGTLVSIKALSSNLTSNGSGVATIANGTVGNSTVTITGLANSTTYASTFGMIVETTTTLNTYTFHRQVPKATEVTTVSGSISNVNTVAGAISNVNAVAGNATNINTVAGSNSNITSVAGSISNVNQVASNLSGVNAFGERYSFGANNPTSSLDTGDLFFNTSANELKVYNGSAWQGGVTASGNFASTTGNTWTGDNLYNDGVKAKFGTGSDLQIYHDGTDNIIHADGNLIVKDANHTSAIFDTSAEVQLYYDNSKKFETTSTGILIDGSNTTGSEVRGDFRFKSESSGTTKILWDGSDDLIRFFDSSKAVFGTSDDLKIYHDGSNSYLWDTGTGDLHIMASDDLKLRSDDIHLMSYSGDETFARFIDDGAVELYYDNTKRFETVSDGIRWTGHCYANDNYKLRLGTGDDLQIYHNGNDNFIDAHTGPLYIRGDGQRIHLQSVDGENSVRCAPNSHVKLYYDGTEKFATQGGGIKISGGDSGGSTIIGDVFFDNGSQAGKDIDWDQSTGKWTFYDNTYAQWGTGGDLQIYHTGSASFIDNTGTGIFYIRGNGSNSLRLRAKSDENSVTLNPNAAVELYYDNVKKFETTSTGTKTTGTRHWVSNPGGSAYLEVGGGATDNQYAYIDLVGDTTYTDYGLRLIRNNGGANTYSSLVHRGTGPLHITAQDAGSISLNTSNTAALTIASNHDSTFTGDVSLADSKKLKLGASDDLQLYHNGTDSFIINTTGNLVIKDDNQLILRSPITAIKSANNTEACAKFFENGAVELYYDNAKKFETTSAGTTTTGNHVVSGLVACDGLLADDNEKIKLGSGEDLQIYHDGNHSYIYQDGTGELRTNTATFRVMDRNGSETQILASENGAVSLYYDNVEKLATVSDGAKTVGKHQFQGHGQGNGAFAQEIYFHSNAAHWGTVYNGQGPTGNTYLAAKFVVAGTGGSYGSIQYTTSGTSYNTSSDYRLKENEVAISDGITRLKTLKPYRFNFKTDPSKTVDGFFAHEVTAVPEAINGEKMQQIDQSKLVPLLVASLQEAITKIETLETKVAALESS